MRVLHYSGLDTSRVEVAFRRIVAALEQDDFRAADVKKLVGVNHGKFYRAKLDDRNRLLFALVRHGAKVCAIMLEVIENHAYARSRFLRGAAIDEEKIPAILIPPPLAEAPAVKYLHVRRREILYLDKPLSLDDVQQEIYGAAPPLVMIGGAGSGKTALTLEKLKLLDGDVLYVTHSAFLAKNARDLYYAHGFVRDGQESAFYSYRCGACSRLLSWCIIVFTGYNYFATGIWQWSTSSLLNPLGQSSVALFFMCTGFLFALKASSPTVKWKALYISRLARASNKYRS